MNRFAVLLLAALLLLPAASARAQAPYWSTGFEAGVPAEIEAPGSVLAGVAGWAGLGAPGGAFGGSFLRYTSVPLHDTRLVLRNLPPHSTVSLGFLLAVIDSWDGTELLQVRVDGALLFDHWFQLATGDASSYAAPAGALLSSGTNLGFSAGSWYGRDRAYDLGLEPAFRDLPHAADSLVVTWSLGAISGPAASQWQGGDDESWAIDEVRVWLGSTLDAPPAGRGALSLAAAGPNPSAGGRLQFRFTLGAAGPARLELFDAAGRRCGLVDAGGLVPGAHTAAFGTRSPLAPGLYLARLSGAGGSRTVRAVVLR